MAKRSQSIRALLVRAQRDFEKLKSDYTASLANQAISDDLRIDIKNICGNLRSALDYLAADIRESCCPTAKSHDRFYFPILPTRPEFEAQSRKWYPELESAKPAVWNYLESIQPYHTAFEWLGQLNRVNNEHKHDDLVEQSRLDVPRITVSTPGGGMVSWDPGSVRFGSGVSIGGVPVDPRTQLPVPHPSQKVEKVIWVDFRFKDPDVSVLELLRASVGGITKIADELETLF